MRTTLFILTIMLAPALSGSAQVEFDPPLGPPAYAAGLGPRVGIDGGHGNLHTVDGTYATFASLLRRDGFRVDGPAEAFSVDSLRGLDILVIANALAEDRASPALTEAEVDAVENWVRAGGSLILVADHAPWPAAIQPLAGRFGVEFANAYAYDGPPDARQGSLTYGKAAGSLLEHAVTEGVQAVANFLGSAFRVDGPHAPLMRMGPDAVAQRGMGEAFAADAEPIGGWLQGALLERGNGRVAVFGEAAMLSAQERGPDRRPMGMNAPGAEDNARFVLNVVRWLASTP